MEGLISLLLFAAFFYLMMRVGCGAHMVHGHGGGREAGARHKDPVCGMDVDPEGLRQDARTHALPLLLTAVPGCVRGRARAFSGSRRTGEHTRGNCSYPAFVS